MKKEFSRFGDVLKALNERGISDERIASDLDYSFASIQNWKSGRRKPKLPVIVQVEYLYGVKITRGGL